MLYDSCFVISLEIQKPHKFCHGSTNYISLMEFRNVRKVEVENHTAADHI